MTNLIIGRKVKMDQIFKDTDVIPVTWIMIDESQNLDFAEGTILSKIVSVSKGKGFQGVVKRHGFAGGPKTHGQKNRHRAPGSIGATAPQRVIPGVKMAGRMGGDKQTKKRIKVIKWSALNKMLAVLGPVPGARGSKVKIFL